MFIFFFFFPLTMSKSIHVPANYPYKPQLKSSQDRSSRGVGLLEASRNGSLEQVKRALDRGADIGEKKLGFSALHYAVCYNHYDIVEYLVEYGADVNDQNLSGITPLIRYVYVINVIGGYGDVMVMV